MVGQTISHYRITEKLGEGGMGVVYKAEDTKLDRPVALKFLAAHLVSDEEVRKRFEREAKAAAALNHPNICTVHEIDEFEGKTFIAMAFLEGEGLDKKIEAGPLKLKDALDVAIQTAQGLQAAHEKGIVHRDIKPANLMVTGSGSKRLVTIMDFGLAQLADRSKLTRMDETMGTVTYMSPEQTYGVDLDHRSDIWSLGVVIYEMVVGEQPFKGHYDKAVMYSITNEEPEPITALRTGVPMELELLVNKCLAKDADRRYQSTADMVVDLETLSEKFKSGKSTIMPAVSSQSVGARHAVPAPSQQAAGIRAQHAVPLHSAMEVSEHPLVKYRVIEDGQETGDAIRYVAEDTELHRSVAIRVLPQSSEHEIERAQHRKQTMLLGSTALAVLFGLVVAFFAWFSPAPVAEAPVRRFALTTDTAPTSPSISPNGRHVVYLTGGQGNRILWVQDLDQDEPRSIVGPGNTANLQPSWSPDSEFICFRSANELKKVSVSGGPTVTVCEVSGNTFGASWTPDGDSIIFHMRGQLHTVSAGGGRPEPWLKSQQERSSPRQLAFFSSETGIEKLLYVGATSTSDAQIIALDRVSGQREILTPGRRPVYDPSGHVIYQSNAPLGLWAVPFSVDTMKATGNPFSIAENSNRPSVAGDGTLVYLEGLAATGLQQLVWRDREGNPLGTIGQPQNNISYPALSPDGKRVAVLGSEGGPPDIWIHEVDRPVKTRLTTDDAPDLWPTWSPTGDRIAFASGRTGIRDLYVKRADGSGEATPLLLTEGAAEYLTDWSKDEKILLFFRRLQGGGDGGGIGDIFYLRLKDDGSYEEVPFQTTQFEEVTPKFSPDEQFIAYVSDESGQSEIYIQAFPEGGNKRRVSVNGGFAPRWRADGKELFYVEGETLMATPVSTSPSLTVGSPEALFAVPGLAFQSYNFLNYDVTPEGDKFILRETVETDTEAQPVIRVVQNWYEEFRGRQQN